MSRLDRHVISVRNKLALGLFVRALAWTSLVLAVLVWGTILVYKLVQVLPPHPMTWFWGGVGAAALAALAYSLWRRPSAHDAAVAIDLRLGLKEKFSTALCVRSSIDPFARAAVLDAERTADVVSLRRTFPLSFPRASLGTVAISLLAALTLLMDPIDLFGKEEARRKELAERVNLQESRKAIEEAIKQVAAIPVAPATQEQINQAKGKLEELLNQSMRSPEQAQRSAARVLSEMNEALKQKVQQSQAWNQRQVDKGKYSDLMPGQDEKGPVADARREIAKGNYDQAAAKIEEALEKLDQMTDKQRQDALDQMKAMAEQLNQMANDPKVQQEVQKQLEQMGLSPEQAQQAVDQMQKAAQGDQQAAQQLQQLAQQQMQQMNNGQGPTPQQQQQMQQMMQQMQTQMNSQMQAQQMGQAAQQMASAMQQAQQAGQGSPQQQPGQSNQQMGQATQQMQQQLQAMQAMAQDAQQVAKAQQAAAQAAAQAAGQLGDGGKGQGQGQNAGQGQGQGQGQNEQQPGQAQAGGQGQGQWKPGDAQQQGQGMGGPGRGAGGNAPYAVAPAAFKDEFDPSQDIESGKLLANVQIRDKNERGESVAEFQQIVQSAQREATDEIDTQRVGRQAQNAVKEYFRSLEEQAK
jgi:hypothetical protein